VLAADPDSGFTADPSVLVVGELSLDGAVRPVRGVLPLAARALADGLSGIMVPRENVAEAAVVRGLEVYPADSLSQVVEGLKAKSLSPVRVDADSLFKKASVHQEDFSEVRGQAHAKRALEIAAAGGHNMLMTGPPGSGKTMLARRLPTILPSMTWEEAVETSRIYSVAGLLSDEMPLMAARPFRSPHHSVSDAGLIGGGANPRPGEATLAHNGVLFLDELPEFKRNILELLRQPLEDGTVNIVRAVGAVTFPARFMLVGAMNPCPCGYLGDEKRHCSCPPSAVERYSSRISGPLLDRFDIRVEVGAVKYREIAHEDGAEEASSQIRERVERARAVQAKRLSPHGIYRNAEMGATLVRRMAKPEASAGALLEHAMDRMGMSARAYSRTLKVARTIADLDARVEINKTDVLEALSLRGASGARN
jgi:magnesium chelatase family protein